MFFEFDYDQLLPPSGRRGDRSNFFIACPPSARQDACFITQWLRHCDVNCDVQSSLHPGNWLSFLKADHGTLILHEDAIWAVRLFPSFGDLLRAPTGAFNFFLFKKTSSLLHLPSLQDSSCSGSSISSKSNLCQIFRPGMVFLLTPSFLLSQPEQAYVFVKWFWQNYSRSSQVYRRGKLVVCSDIQDWTLDLALEQSRKITEKRCLDEGARIYGGTSRPIETYFKTLCLLRNLIADTTDEVDGLVVLAPEIISANDEQSLVNWFGWWAIMNLERFRKFCVIGSDDQHPARLSARVKVPSCPKVAPMASSATLGNQDGATVPQTLNAAWQLVNNDDAGTLSDYLGRIDEWLRNKTFRPMVLYKYVVSYWDPDMAFHFQDYASAFKSFHVWLNSFAEFVNVAGQKPGLRGFVNSYAGFFYTVEGEWDRRKYVRGTKPARRPWIAILRPTNPHIRPWSTSELFIWDCTAWAQHTGRSAISLNDLICAQQELVRLIRESHLSTELPLQAGLVRWIHDRFGRGYTLRAPRHGSQLAGNLAIEN